MNSRPASSARTLIAAMSSQWHGHRSGARLIVSPPSQLALNTPSLNRLGPNSGLLARDVWVLDTGELAHGAIELREVDVLLRIQPDAVHVESALVRFARS